MPGAVLVPLGTVPDHVDAFTGDGPTYVICRSGGRSMRACEYVAAHLDGVDVVNVAGGTLAWIAVGPRHRRRGSALVTERWVDRQADLDDLLDVLVAEPRYAIDTEFHREKTYFPRLALVQLAWPRRPRRSSTRWPSIRARWRKLFESPALAVAHAAQQDLDVLTHAVGAVPARLFDTQVAAGFVGYGTPSLVSLLQGELGITPAKGDRLTDWLRRPLTDDQQAYAAADVASLLELQDRLVGRARRARAARLGRGGVRGAAHPPDRARSTRWRRGCS